MKEAELALHTTCSCCGKLITHSGLPLFWRIKVERFGINAQAVKRQMGLSMHLGGNPALAQILGPDEDMAGPVMEPKTLTLCEPCAYESPVIMQALG